MKPTQESSNGFEHTPPEGLVLKKIALDHSATLPVKLVEQITIKQIRQI